MKRLTAFILVMTALVLVLSYPRPFKTPHPITVIIEQEAVGGFAVDWPDDITQPSWRENLDGSIVVTNLGADGSILLVTQAAHKTAYTMGSTPEQLRELRNYRRERLKTNDQFKAFFVREAELKEKVEKLAIGETTLAETVALLGPPTSRAIAPAELGHTKSVFDYAPDDVLHRSPTFDRVHLTFNSDGKLEEIEWEQ